MDTTSLNSTGPQVQSIKRPHPLPSVIVWELRRFAASRLFWLQATGFFCLVLSLMWGSREPNQFENLNGATGAFVAGTSPWGLLINIPLALVLLGLLLPFLTTDSVTRDLSRRTHELLLTTALPTWAYVWGRYLASLLLSLGLAVLSLLAILGLGWLLHFTTASYPAPESGATLLLWVGMIVPATILLSSLGFALGTLFPRMGILIKVVLLLAWVLGSVIIPIGLRDSAPPTWYVNWDPTSAGTALGLIPHYLVGFQNRASAVSSGQQLQHILNTFENKMPNLSGWFISHLLLAVFSLALVLIAVLLFKRTRQVLN